MTQHPLDGVRAKIKRAKQHFDQLCADSAGIEDIAYSLRAEKDFESRVIRYFAIANDVRVPLLNFALLAGECAYQLRSALDHAVFQLRKQPTDTKTQFPIFKTADGYKSRAPAMIQGVSISADAIIESLQPYHRGGAADEHPLWMLSDINNTDKHRIIPVCFIYANHIAVTQRPGERRLPMRFDTMRLGGIVKDGTKVCEIPMPHTEVDMKAEFKCSIAFEQIGGAKLQRIRPFLLKAMGEVSSIVELFSGEFV